MFSRWHLSVFPQRIGFHQKQSASINSPRSITIRSLNSLCWSTMIDYQPLSITVIINHHQPSVPAMLDDFFVPEPCGLQVVSSFSSLAPGPAALLLAYGATQDGAKLAGDQGISRTRQHSKLRYCQPLQWISNHSGKTWHHIVIEKSLSHTSHTIIRWCSDPRYHFLGLHLHVAQR